MYHCHNSTPLIVVGYVSGEMLYKSMIFQIEDIKRKTRKDYLDLLNVQNTLPRPIKGGTQEKLNENQCIEPSSIIKTIECGRVKYSP